jgi:outer membrane protein assembly factor BamB
VANNILYVDNYDTSTFASKLDALDANTGAFKWSYSFGYGGGGVAAPVAVASGKLFVPSNGSLLCLDANTGSLKWKYSVPPIVSENTAFSSPAIFNNIVYCTSYKTLYALDATTGALKWTYLATNGINGSVAIFNGVVYFGDGMSGGVGGKIYAINASNGAVKWIYALLSNQQVSGTPVVANNVLYVTMASNGAAATYGILALDANTGAIKWKNFDPDFIGAQLHPPALGNGLLYFINPKGTILQAYDANTGVRKLGIAYYGGDPAISNGLVFTQYTVTPGKFCALDASTGVLKWSYPVNQNFGDYSSAAVYNGKVYLHAEYGYLYCFGQ